MKESRYKYYKSDVPGKVICVSTYAGKTVRGVASCSPHDNYDDTVGMDLARARCDVKVAQKRRANAERRLAEAEAMVAAAKRYRDRMMNYYNDAYEQDMKAKATLCNMETKLV